MVMAVLLPRLSFWARETIKADNGVKYRCLRLAYQEYEKGKYKRIVDFYITDDENHVPVRLDMFLKFGSAKAFLVGMKGVRNPVTSIVEVNFCLPFGHDMPCSKGRQKIFQRS